MDTLLSAQTIGPAELSLPPTYQIDLTWIIVGTVGSIEDPPPDALASICR
ncbi:hypothetical protein ACVXZ4_09945 [Lacisediminihabitans sp. FW035]